MGARKVECPIDIDGGDNTDWALSTLVHNRRQCKRRDVTFLRKCNVSG